MLLRSSARGTRWPARVACPGVLRSSGNVGIAIFALKKEAFYATLLRQDSLGCRDRFQGLESVAARIEESVKMNLEFAERVRERGKQAGLDIGFSTQPLIERLPDESLHPAIDGAAELAKALQRRFS